MSSHGPLQESGAADVRSGTARYSWYVLAVLTFSYTLAYIDRQVLNLLVDPIKGSLALTDTQFSFIQGAAFISAYLLAVPLFGRLVDVTNRRNVLMFGVAAWSLFTALCARADTYTELFVARFGIGAAEACVLPVGWSLIADYFSKDRAPRALSIFMLGPLIGGGFSLLAGGAVLAFADRLRLQFPGLAGLETWQLAFLLVALPGALLIAALLMVREPSRRLSFQEGVDERQFTLGEAAAFLWGRRRFYGRIYLGISMVGIVLLGTPAWLPSYLIRFHGVEPATVGYQLGLLTVVCGSAGVLTGPWLARALERSGYKDGTLRAAACSTIGMLVCCILLAFSPGAVQALLASGAMIFFFSAPTGIMAATMQVGTPSRVRGIAAALYTFWAQLIGYGVGPTAVALFTDRVFGDPRMVGYSLGIVCSAASVIAIWMLFSALPHYRRLLEEQQSAETLAGPNAGLDRSVAGGLAGARTR